MFGFLIAGEVNDDAVALKQLTDMAVNKYANLSKKELIAAVSHDFDEYHRHIDFNAVSFTFRELSEFRFSLDLLSADRPPYALTVSGNAKYLGFMLSSPPKSKWACSWSHGIGYRATAGAKKLVKVMDRKFDILDTSKLMKDYG
jgi:hypothetical protein